MRVFFAYRMHFVHRYIFTFFHKYINIRSLIIPNLRVQYGCAYNRMKICFSPWNIFIDQKKDEKYIE